uniref:Uncharacterized protein n=1 Tax=Oryza barthii TaxID=65489 RepID=A0A0D3HS49_9ORYZ
MAPRETLAASRSGSPVRRGEGRGQGARSGRKQRRGWSSHDEVSLGDDRWVPRDSGSEGLQDWG